MGYVDDLRAAGLTVTVNERGNLWVTPAALLTDDLRAMLKDQKWAILAELAGNTPATLAVAEKSEQIARPVIPWDDICALGHGKAWERSEKNGGGWVCAICHPPLPGQQVRIVQRATP